MEEEKEDPTTACLRFNDFKTAVVAFARSAAAGGGVIPEYFLKKTQSIETPAELPEAVQAAHIEGVQDERTGDYVGVDVTCQDGGLRFVSSRGTTIELSTDAIGPWVLQIKGHRISVAHRALAVHDWEIKNFSINY